MNQLLLHAIIAVTALSSLAVLAGGGFIQAAQAENTPFSLPKASLSAEAWTQENQMPEMIVRSDRLPEN